MKNRIKKYKLGFIFSILIIGMTIVSCEKYLNKAPGANVTQNDVFGNFVSFQGFVEEIYDCVTDIKGGGGSTCTYRLADETLYPSPIAFDDGNYWSQGDMFYGNGVANTNADLIQYIWPQCWWGIWKANQALSKLPLLVNATQEEKDIIKGQALFFRGWCHFELMRYWGGLPYIDTVLSSSQALTKPRLNYRQTALKAAQDFRDAAALLPVDWDLVPTGLRTQGNNKSRVSKLWALSYLGKDLLYAASPMMNEESTGNATFDAALCQEAAQAFATVINTANSAGYKLLPWSNWTDNYWVWSPNNTVLPGGDPTLGYEAIMQTTIFNVGRIRYQSVGQDDPVQMGQGNNTVYVPTNNYVKNYAMANGLPIDDPLSGYNPNDPWTGREPRFYKDIIIDGDELVANSGAGLDRYAQLYTGGRHRGGSQGSATGYFLKRVCPKGSNKWDNFYNNFQSYIPYMRLADVYLMYAEAVLWGYGTPQSSVSGTITAEQALNAIRNRAQLPNLTAAYTASAPFWGELIRERAVELGYDLTRFNDLRRWNLNGDAKYTVKTAIDFDRDLLTGKPKNIVERIVTTRVAPKKCNWLPFQVKFTMLYPGFPQNPGW